VDSKIYIVLAVLTAGLLFGQLPPDVLKDSGRKAKVEDGVDYSTILARESVELVGFESALPTNFWGKSIVDGGYEFKNFNYRHVLVSNWCDKGDVNCTVLGYKVTGMATVSFFQPKGYEAVIEVCTVPRSSWYVWREYAGVTNNTIMSDTWKFYNGDKPGYYRFGLRKVR